MIIPPLETLPQKKNKGSVQKTADQLSKNPERVFTKIKESRKSHSKIEKSRKRGS